MRWTRIAAFFLLGTGLTTGMVRGSDGDAGDASKVQRGFAIAPLPLNLKGRNPDLVGLGSYIVNAQGVCNSCHTNPPYAAGGNPFLGQPIVINANGYLLGGVSFGPFVSRNLRPELPSGLPAGRTYAQFLQIMQQGTDLDNTGQLLQVMPWPVFQDMTERDLRAIYEYLSALPPAP
jgi:hypothetical protein